jgi:hypothetical protein
MATLTGAELDPIRRGAAEAIAMNTVKANLNLAIQACEDYYENTARAGFGAAIEAAAPGVFTANQKKQIGKYWLQSKFGRE